MQRDWEAASEDEKIALLDTAYEAFAQKAASAMKDDFILPARRSYRNLLAASKSEKGKRRISRVRSVFRRLAKRLDERGFFYRDYIACVFDTWRTPRKPKEFYRLRYKVPAAFPLPQHLLDEELLDQFATLLNAGVVKSGEETAQERQDRMVEAEFRKAQRFVADLLLKNPRRFPDIEAVLSDPIAFPMISPSYLRRSKEFERLVVSGFYRKYWGEETHRKFLAFLAETTAE